MATEPTPPQQPAAGDPDARASRSEQSVQAFRQALEASVTIPRERLQEVVDDAVRRGRITRADAEDLVSRLLSRGREQADSILAELERVVAQLGEEVGERAAQQRRAAARTTARTRRELEDATERARREVREYEQSHKARKGLLRALDRKLGR